MLRLVQLLLPALIPSWRFFKDVGPSPRLQVRLTEGGTKGPWRDAMPQRARLRLGAAVRGLFRNPDWNEYLYLISCCERLVQTGSAHSLQEINHRLAARCAGQGRGAFQFRIVFVARINGQEERVIGYESAPCSALARAA
jgi:hypothetical protein